jgi:hypothetical protein
VINGYKGLMGVSALKMIRYLKPYRGKNTSHFEEWAITPQKLSGLETSSNPLKKGLKRHESRKLNT